MNRNLCIGLLVTLLILTLTGCVTTTFRPEKTFDARQAVPVDSASVRVVSEAPREAYRQLGEIRVHVTGYMSDEAILEKARERAAQIGADTLVYVRERREWWAKDTPTDDPVHQWDTLSSPWPAEAGAAARSAKRTEVRYRALSLVAGGKGVPIGLLTVPGGG